MVVVQPDVELIERKKTKDIESRMKYQEKLERTAAKLNETKRGNVRKFFQQFSGFVLGKL